MCAAIAQPTTLAVVSRSDLSMALSHRTCRGGTLGGLMEGGLVVAVQAWRVVEGSKHGVEIVERFEVLNRLHVLGHRVQGTDALKRTPAVPVAQDSSHGR